MTPLAPVRVVAIARDVAALDVSSQDANLVVGAFAIQRLGDGAVEHRAARGFRYGGVIACADGYLELLTLGQRQHEDNVFGELLGMGRAERDALEAAGAIH